MEIRPKMLFALAGALIAILSMGCERLESENLFSPEQKHRERVVEEFSENAMAAKEKYIEIWKEQKTKSTSGQEQLGAVVMLAIAGELMVHDDSNYSEYYSYVVNYVDSPDLELAASSVSALSRARGIESLKYLAHHAGGDNDDMARDAMTALNYRLVTSLYDPELAADKQYIFSILPTLCANKFSAELGEFCSASS